MPQSEQKAVVCLVHGLGEHSGRYRHVAEFLNEQGFALLAFDLRGHGKSGGQRGHTPSLEAFMNEIDLLLEEAEGRYASKPRFLYGHSLGAILALVYALKRSPHVKGVISSGVGLRTALEEQKLKVALVKTGGRWLSGLSLPSGLKVSGLSRDPRVVEDYVADPLVHNRTTLGLGWCALEAIDYALAHGGEFNIPLLVMHGASDPLAYARGSLEFAEKVHYDRTVKLWDGLYHEIHNEPEKEEVLGYLAKWMDSKL